MDTSFITAADGLPEIVKDPDETLDYTVLWTDWLRGSDGYWTPGTFFGPGATVTPSKSQLNGYRYRTLDGGTSGTTEPTWPTSSTVADSAITWTTLGTVDTISSVAWTVATGITNAATSNTTHTATITLSGGTMGQDYLVACKVTTAAGLIGERTFRVKVRRR